MSSLEMETKLAETRTGCSSQMEPATATDGYGAASGFVLVLELALFAASASVVATFHLQLVAVEG